MTLHLGDSLEVLKTLEANSVDSVVTDPPYGLAFMGKKWDYDVPSVELWREVFRVLKPGAHLLSFGGTRTYHRMVCAIEDAGFEIRDQVMWIYGSGFPKSHNISKAIDKINGSRGNVVGKEKNFGASKASDGKTAFGDYAGEWDVTTPATPATPAAQEWSGWGTALKPANEPIVLARKPLEPKLTVAANVLKHGTGAINVDASRIGSEVRENAPAGSYLHTQNVNDGRSAEVISAYNEKQKSVAPTSAVGRWPANVLFDEEAAAVLDEQSGNRPSRGEYKNRTERYEVGGVTWKHGGNVENTYANEKGGASRFFYVAKTSKRERNAGLEGMPDITSRQGMGGKMPVDDDGNDRDRFSVTQKNHHPTVKPIKLMEYLVRMITPAGGVVLDPFMGSGTTGCAAKRLGFKFIGIEREPEYLSIATKRIEHWANEYECGDVESSDQMEMVL